MTAKVTAKKSTPKRPPARPRPAAPAPVEAVDGPQVLRFDADTEDVEPEEREPLFYIGDREYTIPKVMRTNDALECLHQFRTQGEALAVDFLLERLLGEEAYTALRSYRRLRSADLARIIEIAQERMMGAAEAPKA